MFLRLRNDWVYAGMGSCVGFNKQTLQWYMDLYQVSDKVGMLEDLAIMEDHVRTLTSKD